VCVNVCACVCVSKCLSGIPSVTQNMIGVRPWWVDANGHLEEEIEQGMGAVAEVQRNSAESFASLQVDREQLVGRGLHSFTLELNLSNSRTDS